MKKNIAVILAGGSGVRSGFDRPKQMIKLAGKPVISHTLKVFNQSDCIDEIAIVTSKDSYDEIHNIVNSEGFSKVKKILLGGKERWESSWSAIDAYATEANIADNNLIFHDAVRPLLDDTIIQNVVEALNTNRAVDVVIKTVDTIVEVDESTKCIGKILDRSKLRNGQTPQAFKYSLIRDAYLEAFKDKELKVTDDCGIVSRYFPEEKIFLVEGSSYNMKLTYNEDLAILDKLFQFKSSLVSVNMKEEELAKLLKNAENKVFVVFGGSSGIGQEFCKLLEGSKAKAYSFSRSNNCNVQQIEDVQDALKQVFEKEKKIDFVINTTGILLKQPLASMSHADILATINTNYLGSVNVAYSAFQYLKDTKGSLLLFTSSSYTYGRAFYSIYSSSKAAVVNFTQALAEEWIEFGIRVNCLNPERTSTPMRVAAFGKEDPNTLLNALDVAKATLKTVLFTDTGLIVDVKRKT